MKLVLMDCLTVKLECVICVLRAKFCKFLIRENKRVRNDAEHVELIELS
jgi:hypothetical protein